MLRLSRMALIGAAALLVIVLGTGLALFQPYKLFINERADEPNPVASLTPAPSVATASGAPTARTLYRGALRSLEHPSSGRVEVIALADGSRILRLEQLRTSNGPDLRIYISAAPASGDWHGYDREYVDLGALKANLGSQNYAIGNAIDLARYRSAVIWCRRFKVGFAVAPLVYNPSA
jgi:hypothetical protein